ncbi:MAG: DUF4373 domain-containing protein [Dehalococcoidales bacterium]|jgi:hypothetical protein|nr:DUF4373 domain-containing protein [Dehalococcoidales bacterium]
MAGRPEKTTVEYFPHFTASKKTIFTLEGLYGNDGYAFWFKLLEILGSSQGHYYKFCSKSDWLYLVSRTGVSEERAKSILNTLVDLEAIDEKLYKKNVIWSDNFLKNIAYVYEKRKGEIPKKPIIDNGKVIFGDGNSITDIKKTGSKGTKGSELKEGIYGEFQNVKLTDDEIKKLESKFGKENASKKIENLSQYIASKGKRYKSHYATILNWSRSDKPVKYSSDTCIPSGAENAI